MALDSKPEEMFDKVLAPVESQITAKEETEMIAKEKLEEMVKEENVIFLISDKQVRKEESRKKKIHVCPHKYCEQSFSRPCSLASHIRSHTSKCSHQCKVPGCEKAHFSSSHLRRHKATSHMSLPIFKTLLKCPHPSCMAQLSSSSSLKRHYWRIHKQQHLFTCSFCDKRFFRQSQWQAHLYEHTGVPPIICPTCHLGFISLRDFNHHNRQHQRTYSCDFPGCGEQFEYYTHLLRHTTLDHPTEFICDICNKSFKAKCRLSAHMSVHKDLSQRPVLSCPYNNCTRSYFYKKNLVYHVKVSHKGKRLNHEQNAKNVITQSEREQMEGVTNVLAWKRDDANQEGNTLQELQVMPESSSSVFPHGVEDSSCFSSSRDYKIMIKVEPDSNSDTHQLPSCGETEQKQDPVLSAVKSEDLEGSPDIAIVKEEVKEEVTTEEN